eukprot:scaffold123217_cov49-Attheya_sp.AAC.6
MLATAKVPQTGVESSGNERNSERVRVPSQLNQASGKTKINRDAVKKKSAESATAIRVIRQKQRNRQQL